MSASQSFTTVIATRHVKTLLVDLLVRAKVVFKATEDTVTVSLFFKHFYNSTINVMEKYSKNAIYDSVAMNAHAVYIK